MSDQHNKFKNIIFDDSNEMQVQFVIYIFWLAFYWNKHGTLIFSICILNAINV